jgi:hypothetical protein
VIEKDITIGRNGANKNQFMSTVPYHPRKNFHHVKWFIKFYKPSIMNDLLPASKQMIQHLLGKGPAYQPKGPARLLNPANANEKNEGEKTPSRLLNPNNLNEKSEGLKGQALPLTFCPEVSQVSSPTSLDMTNSMIYARNRILHDKCQNLAAGGAGVEWQPIIPDGSTPYQCPSGLMTGATGQASSSTCYYGHCAFTTEIECKRYSKLPYDPITGASTPSATGAFYMEWRSNPSSATGSKCYLGNAPFRRWCELPSARDPPDSSPPFKYTSDGPNGGTCSLTEEYCTAKNSSWDEESKSCYKSSGQLFVEALFGNTIDAWFQGNCGTNPFLSTGKQTTHANSKNKGHAPSNFSGGPEALRFPIKYEKLSDRRLKTRLVKICPDYAGKGAHLYSYSYTPEAYDLISAPKSLQLGFMADEIEQIYPEIVKTVNGFKWISFTPEQLRERKYWRIINTIRNEHLILQLLLSKTVLKPMDPEK